MKTQMTKFKPSKKAPPSLPRHGWHIKGFPPSLCDKPLEQGYKLRRERELSRRILVSLSAETDDGPVKINVVKVETSLGSVGGNPQSLYRIDARIVVHNRFAHRHSEKFYFGKRRVLGYFVATDFGVSMLDETHE